MKTWLINIVFAMLLIINCSKDKQTISPEYNSTNTGQIVYTSDFESNKNIYSMDFDGKNKNPLTNNPGEDNYPKFSPDGEKIAYFSNYNGQGSVWIMHVDGSNKKRLFDVTDASSGSPFFNPDGNCVLHLSNNEQFLHIIHTDGSNYSSIKVAMYTNYVLCPFDFSPDGSRIVFSSNLFDPSNYDICLMDINTKHIKKIDLPFESEYDLGPRFSPVENMIVFFSEGENMYHIYSYDLQTNNQKKLTPDSIQLPFDPIFTTDGSKIIFTAETLLPKAGTLLKPLGNPSLFIMNPDGSHLQQLSAPSSYSREVVLSDLGGQFYYINQGGIYMVNASNLEQQRIVELPYDIYLFFQYKDYFYFNYDGVIFRINIDGSDLINLTDPGQNCFNLQLQPDNAN
jgi:Tol biopolymer transport system component